VITEQESNRTASSLNADGLAVSSNVDDKTMHELYLWPFQDAVEAGTGCVMCSYNRINGTYACNNDKTQNGLLKGELGFKGFIVSDWDAQHSGVDTAINGLDVVMPDSVWWENGGLAASVQNGTLSLARLEDMALRTIATWFKFGQNSALLPAIGSGETSNLSAPHTFVNARDPASAPTILQGAIEGHVLVKNVNNALPLQKPNIISLFGNDATAGAVQGSDVFVGVFGGNTSTDLFNFNWHWFGDNTYDAYFETNYAPKTVNGTLITGGGSGSNTPPYISTVSYLTSRSPCSILLTGFLAFRCSDQPCH
jgi:beta-glucosidase